jgi:hypothetical protein
MEPGPEECEGCVIRGDWTYCEDLKKEDKEFAECVGDCSTCGCYVCCYGENPWDAAIQEYERSRGV